MQEYKINDEVVVTTPQGEFAGTVRRVLPDYAGSGITRYEITGPEILTISSAAQINLGRK